MSNDHFTPVAPLVAANAVARRICDWINETHQGNVRAAARALDLDHATLWRAATGRWTQKPIAVIETLARHTGTTIDWWITGREPGGTP